MLTKMDQEERLCSRFYIFLEWTLPHGAASGSIPKTAIKFFYRLGVYVHAVCRVESEVFGIIPHDDMVSLLESDDKRERDKAIAWWIDQDSDDSIERLLFPLLFTGRDYLDSSVVQVVVNREPDLTRRVIELAFERLPKLVCDEQSRSHSINALAKYTAQQPEVAMSVYLDYAFDCPGRPAEFRIVECFLRNVRKLPVRQLADLELSGVKALLSTFRSDTSKWYPGDFQILRGLFVAVLDRAGQRSVFAGDYLTELFLRRAVLDKDIWSHKVPKRWHNKLTKLTEDYKRLASIGDAEVWYGKFSVVIYEMLHRNPEVFTENWNWRRVAIKLTKPQHRAAREIAWRIVSEHGIVNPDRTLKPESSLGVLVFNHLLSCGDLSALEVLKTLITDGTQPDQRTCESLRALMTTLSGGLQIYDELDAWVRSIGIQWEGLCRRIAKRIHGHILVHPPLTNGKIPDLIPASGVIWEGKRISRAPLIIEAKKSDSSISFDDDDPVEKYGAYCEELEIWVMAPTPGTPQKGPPGAKVIYAQELAHTVRPLDERLAQDVDDFLNRIKGSDLEATFFSMKARAQGVPESVIENVLVVHRHLVPYFVKFAVQRWFEPTPHH